MKFVIAVSINGRTVPFEAASKDELIGKIYKAGTTGELDAIESVILTDIVEVKYGDEPPGLFSWTEGVKKEAPLED